MLTETEQISHCMTVWDNYQKVEKLNERINCLARLTVQVSNVFFFFLNRGGSPQISLLFGEAFLICRLEGNQGSLHWEVVTLRWAGSLGVPI